MKIKGFEILSAHKDACRRVMGRAFKIDDVIAAAVDAGVPQAFPQPGSNHCENIALLLAKRMVNYEAAAGHVVQVGNTWERQEFN